jgi:hypothetical protein
MGEMDEGKQGKKRESQGGGFWLERNGGEGDVVTVSCRSNRQGLKMILTHGSRMSGGRGTFQKYWVGHVCWARMGCSVHFFFPLFFFFLFILF